MLKVSGYTTGVLEYLAEGSPYQKETPEPFNPLKTSVMPAILSETDSAVPASETGTTPAVEMKAEHNEAPDGQDVLRVDEEMKPMVVAEAASSGEKTKSAMILIIEDTLELAEIIQATLERINLVTLHETHGARALSLLNEKNPDLVLLDISLPDMTGWKILDVIKEQHAQNNTKMPIVVVITAYDDPANRLVGKLQGVYSYLIKPFTADEVEKIVLEALQGAATDR